jgi:hypothetical protein
MNVSILLAFALGAVSALTISVFGLVAIICYAIKHAKDGDKDETAGKID